MIHQLLLPFQFSFMIKGMIITIVLAVPMAMLSCFLILKGWALLGDAISHAVFPGVVIGYMATPWAMTFLSSIPFLWFHDVRAANVTMTLIACGAFLAGMICAIATGFLGNNSRIKQDTIMGVVFSSMFGLGLVLATAIYSDLDLNHILFGNLLGVNWLDITQTAIIAMIVVMVLSIKWRDFMLYIFDSIQARAIGLQISVLHYILLTMISLTIVAALQAVGIILVISLLIAPGAIAYLITKRFFSMLLIAVFIAVCSSFLGIYLSLFIGSDSAATIVLILTLIFIAVFISNFFVQSTVEEI
ncbi:Iron transport protein, inner membrane component [Bartonella clarridgeiae 73]|uniref:Iron transport protein, inner membrane component n=1 Tax=Bartonella clarridgeiae (strain CCUG 45776 / CIP 104772 / 73) TaxID=696125 RepID=E6YFZ0_BARC7|nr:metal ABC transporter permease [Bartonella clarridgeiae]WCR55612.1 MAG: Manganese ABC transporter inner membrane permease protein SitD [Bartonella clarridgeiae]CBI75778.1 Iron transport protein, inner membrane component [Bartonella clarridgeiae 73]